MSNGLNIGIVDDDSVYRFTIKRTMNGLDLTKNILTFSDGEEALDYLINHCDDAANLPDIIFLDINMPIMDGFQFVDEYVKIKPRLEKPIAIYMVSSSVDPADIERAKQYDEILDYIIKPISSDQLQDIVTNVPVVD